MAAAVDAASGDAGYDGARPQIAPATVEVVGLVGMEFGRTPPWPAPFLSHWPDGIDDCGQGHAVVALGPRLAAIGRVRPRLLAPLLAGTEEASTLARDQSICPARFNRSSICRWILSQSPASCQARSRRQQVMPGTPPPRTEGAPKGSRCRERTRCRRAHRGPRPKADLPSDAPPVPASTARSPPTNHPRVASSPCPPNQTGMVNKRFC